jgi:hypothetical protein
MSWMTMQCSSSYSIRAGISRSMIFWKIVLAMAFLLPKEAPAFKIGPNVSRGTRNHEIRAKQKMHPSLAPVKKLSPFAID